MASYAEEAGSTGGPDRLVNGQRHAGVCGGPALLTPLGGMTIEGGALLTEVSAEPGLRIVKWRSLGAPASDAPTDG